MKITLIKTFVQSVMAGICIGLGGAVYLSVGGPLGAVLFAFGLLSVIHYRLPLYTGQAGFFETKTEFAVLWLILLGNVIGCFLTGTCLGLPAGIGTSVIESRIAAGSVTCLCRAIGCGIIMTLIVKAARDKSVIPLLYGIPVFILTGFYHSIADAFYLSVSGVFAPTEWLAVVLGNFVGCNVPRLLWYDRKP